MKIIVLAGGLSPERDVSLTSGAASAKHCWKTDTRLIFLTCTSVLKMRLRIWKMYLLFRAQVLRLQKISAQRT